MLHGFIGERIDSAEACKKLVKKIAYNFRLPYFTITPTFSVCPVHGYINGEHFACPHHDHESATADREVKQDEREREKVLVAN